MKPNIGSGDSGETNILGGRRVDKTSPIVAALGAIDEASAAIGLARAFVKDPTRKTLLHECQTVLLKCGAEVASAGTGRATDFDFTAAVKRLDEHLEELSALAPRPPGFLTPGETPAEAALNLARTVVRRAELAVVGLCRGGPSMPSDIPVYLNRLSDLLFDMLCAEMQ